MCSTNILLKRRANSQFTGEETLYSALIAAMIRSGNERAVQRCKMSWFMKRAGCAFQLWDTSLFCDVWEAWTFQPSK